MEMVCGTRSARVRYRTHRYGHEQTFSGGITTVPPPMQRNIRK